MTLPSEAQDHKAAELTAMRGLLEQLDNEQRFDAFIFRGVYLCHNAAVRKRGTLQVSGVEFTYSVQGEDVEVVDVLVGGKPLDPQATYNGVANDFVVFGNPIRYLGFEPTNRQRLELVDSDVVMAAIESTDAIEYTSRLAAEEADKAKQALALLPPSPFRLCPFYSPEHCVSLMRLLNRRMYCHRMAGT